MIPETRYARAGDVHVAYQVAGDGDPVVTFVDQWFSNVDAQLRLPLPARFIDRLSAFGRVLLLDKRGTGLSDPVPLGGLPTLEEWMDDIRAVLDDAGIERTTERAASLGDERWRTALASFHQHVRDAVDRHRGRLIKTMGDGVLVTFDGPARGIRCAIAVRETVNAIGLQIRAGLHAGEIDLVSSGGDVGGIAVHIAARVCSFAEPGVRSRVGDRQGSGGGFRARVRRCRLARAQGGTR